MGQRVARQDERIAQLERRLNRSSRNSSAPPSADPPSGSKRGKDPSGRKRGAQLGHEGHGRPLLPAWAVDDVIEYWPERCRCELCEELFGARISSGAVDAIVGRAAAALADPHGDLLGRLRGAQALNMDETGWRTAGERHALWGMFDSEHAYFQVASGRHEDHAKELLGNTQAIVTSDRWWAYTHLPLHRRQLCRAHLKRDFQAHAEGLAAEKQFGEAGLVLCERVFTQLGESSA